MLCLNECDREALYDEEGLAHWGLLRRGEGGGNLLFRFSAEIEGKEICEVFFDWKVIVHHEFVPRGQMVNKQLYQEVLVRFRDAVRKKKLELWENQTWMLPTTMRRLTRRSSFAVICQNIRHPLCPTHPILRT